jgi:hypothetical protein
MSTHEYPSAPVSTRSTTHLPRRPSPPDTLCRSAPRRAALRVCAFACGARSSVRMHSVRLRALPAAADRVAAASTAPGVRRRFGRSSTGCAFRTRRDTASFRVRRVPPQACASSGRGRARPHSRPMCVARPKPADVVPLRCNSFCRFTPPHALPPCCSVLQPVATCCGLLQRVAVCCNVLRRVAALQSPQRVAALRRCRCCSAARPSPRGLVPPAVGARARRPAPRAASPGAPQPARSTVSQPLPTDSGTHAYCVNGAQGAHRREPRARRHRTAPQRTAVVRPPARIDRSMLIPRMQRAGDAVRPTAI